MTNEWKDPRGALRYQNEIMELQSKLNKATKDREELVGMVKKLIKQAEDTYAEKGNEYLSGRHPKAGFATGEEVALEEWEELKDSAQALLTKLGE